MVGGNLASQSFDYDVAIVGYGPTGVIAANYLGLYGIKTLVLERDRDLYARARAVTVDGSTMRIFQSLGLAESAKADMEVTTQLRWKTYSGLEILRSKPGGFLTGHETSYMIFQPRMEATLRQGVDRYTRSVEVRFGEECLEVSQDEEGVSVCSRQLETEHPVASRVQYVVAADGGSSKIRSSLGIKMSGETRPRTWVVVDAKVKRWWPERELLTFWADPVRPMVDIPLAMNHHRWEIPLREDERKEDFESNEVIWKLLKPLGVTPEKIEIVSRAFYSHHVRQADVWRRGRVVLAGDAAHLMPPWAGQGMQSGMRDAANIAWKLRAILQCGVSDRILDTYQVERQPHVLRVTQASVQMGRLIETSKGPAQFVRNHVMPLISRTPVLGPRMRRAMSISPDLATGFLAGVPGHSNPLGRPIPQPRIALQDGSKILLDDALGNSFAVVGLDTDPKELMTSAQISGWDALGARYFTIRACHSASKDDADIVDYQNVLGPWLKETGAVVVVLRPDRYVAASDNTSLDVPSLGAGEPLRSAAKVQWSVGAPQSSGVSVRTFI